MSIVFFNVFEYPVTFGASGDGNDSTDSQAVLGVANVRVDAVVL